MRLTRLRNQMLIAMGLPACWSQPPPPRHTPPRPPATEPVAASEQPHGSGDDPWKVGDPGVQPVAIAPPPPPPPPPAPPRPARQDPFAVRPGNPHGCKADHVVETQCGTSNPNHGPDCGPTGVSLVSFGISQLYVSSFAQSARSFVLDPEATTAYQTHGGNTALYCCYTQCGKLDVRRTAKPPEIKGKRATINTRCFPTPPAGTRMKAKLNAACPAAVSFGAAALPYEHSGNPSECCYAYVQERPPERFHYKGRAARVDGEIKVAPVRRSVTWTGDAIRPAVDDLSPEIRARLADAWLRAAQMEHASIASFSALSLRLLALGAPPELVERTHQAALDEIRHARATFELASAYAGAALAPAKFADAGKLTTSGTIAELAHETFVDGCIAETTAAFEASIAADAAEDPAVASVLRAIADEESRHAELAWMILAWCARELGPSLIDELRAKAEQLASAVTTVDAADDLLRHGVLSERMLARVRGEVLAGVIGPCLDALG